MSIQLKIKEIITSIADQELLPRFTKVKRGEKLDGSVITKADFIVQHRIAESLAKNWPDILFLGEEMDVQVQKELLNSGQSVWCLDPLDGTSNFAAGIPYFSVSLALLEHGQTTLGVVYDPMRQEFFAAEKGRGATLNNQLLTTAETGLTLKQATGLIDFKRLTNDLAIRLVTEIPYASQRSFGSIALDWCWIAAGRCHIYLHGKQQLWDYAAGQLILQEAGGDSATLSGEPVFVNALQTRSAVAALDQQLFKQWIAWLKQSHG